MKQASLALCALSGFLLLVGCNSFDLGLLLTGADAAASVRVIDGQPDVVALSLRDTLKRQGFDAEIVKSTDTVVVQSKTSSGLRFGLVLKSVRGADGRDQTHVAMEWMDNRKDQQTSVQLFTEIDRQTGAKKS